MTMTDRTSAGGCFRLATLAVVMMLFAAGCGLKDDLYIPVDESETAADDERAAPGPDEDAQADDEPAP